jgi:thioredoxin reductase/bacterioferritin-associated ferredoxin
MSEVARNFDVVVIGGGPAGLMSAVAACRHGAAVALLDENPAGGGQVYRAAPSGFPPDPNASPEQANGDRLRALLAASGVQAMFAHKVWSVGAGFRVDAIGGQGAVALTAPQLVVATGTTERVVPFPGWTSPGVIGLAAATILLKSQRMLPGRATLVAGCGPLLVAVAAGILKGGGRVVGIVDTAGPRDWLARIPALLSRPDLAARGARWLASIRAARVPMQFHHRVLAARAIGAGLEVTVGSVDPHARHGPRTFSAECLAVGNGLTPSTEITRVLRAEHRYDARRGGWVAVTDAFGRTSVPGLYVTGDGGGIAGAAAAEWHGELAGLAAAHALGRMSNATLRVDGARARRRLDRARRFGEAMGGMMAMVPAQVAAIPGDTIVCRCEDVTRADIERAMDDGAHEVNQVKAWTRCGMGPCQGRSCGDIVGEIVALRMGSRERAGNFTGRLPLRPVSLAAVTGEYRYADIPVPKAAPL